MKANRWSVTLQAMVMSFLLSFGAVGSAVTGLELNVTAMGRLALLCLLVSCVTGLLSRVRFGGWLVTAMIFGALGGIWKIEAWQTQTVDMLCRITRYYNNAYGWVMVHSPLQGNGLMDWPVGCFALWIAAANSWNLSKGLRNHTGMIAAVLPLAASVVVTDTVPGSIYLYLWMLGLVLALLSAGLRKQDPRWGVYLVRLAAVPTALALGLLFWAVPREGYDKHPDELQQRIVDWIQELPDLWTEVRDEVASNLDGAVQPHAVSLDTLGPRLNRVYPVMEVTAPVSGTVYLRGQHYDMYTRDGWTVKEDSRDLFGAPDITRELGDMTVTTRRVRDVIYLPYYPDADQTLLDGCIDNSDRQQTYTYELRSLASHWRNILFSKAQSLSTMQPYFDANGEAATGRYLELPEQTRQWAREYLSRILSDETTATEVADAIGDYVRGSARYDLGTARMSSDYEDFAQWFLAESDTGYCVHFATAATVLLRAAGVEARYVEGYMFTTRMGEETTVTADQAHAWAEYYEPLLDAWIVLEATPADLGEETVTEPETQVPAPTQTQPELTEPPRTLPEHTESPEAGTDILPEGGQGPEDPNPADLGWLRHILWWLLTAAAAVLILEGQRRLRLNYRRQRLSRGSPRKRALAYYRELERLCALLKWDVPEEATHLAEKAKYSRRGAEETELEELEAMMEWALAALKEERWYRKILHKFIFAAY